MGSKSQRGLTQLSLDLLYRSLTGQTLHPAKNLSLIASLKAADASEAQISSAPVFLDGIYGDPNQERNQSRAGTPMTVGDSSSPSSSKILHYTGLYSQWSILGISSPGATPRPNKRPLPVTDTARAVEATLSNLRAPSITPRTTRTEAKLRFRNNVQDSTFVPNMPKRHPPHRPSALPQCPDISGFSIHTDQNFDFAILVSMYEVYNDRIFDLLSHPRNAKDLRRRPLLFKPTDASPDRKVVAGLGRWSVVLTKRL